MSRKNNLLLFIVCITVVCFTISLPFIQKDLYTAQNIFDIFTGKRPEILTAGAILHGDYYMPLIVITIVYLILQFIIISIKDSKTYALLSGLIGSLGLFTILGTCLMLQNDGHDHNFSFLIGFYILILTLITKNIVDWMYFRSKLNPSTTITPTKTNNQILDS